MRNRLRSWMPLLLLLLPQAAYANFSCNGPLPATPLYNTADYCNGVTSIQNIFTGLVCNFQQLLDSIMGNVYCGIQFSMKGPLAAALVLFVMFFGLQLATGYTQARAGEVFMRMLKMALIWVFATDATLGIGVVYNFFMGAANEGISLVFNAIPIQTVYNPSLNQFVPVATPGSAFCNAPLTFNNGNYAQGTAFGFMDYMLCTIITSPFTTQGAMLAGFFAIMAWMIPPIFMMFVYFTFKSLKILIYALFTYLLAISSIAFLITLSPVFFSLALFAPTRHFFEDWIRFLISFTLQIILIFAGIAMWFTVILQLTGFFQDLTTMIRAVQETTEGGDVRMPLNTWGICQYTQQQTFWGPILVCDDSLPPLKPTQLIEHSDFIYFLIINLVAICIVAYTFDALMKILPGLAKQLAGPSHAPQLGGGRGMGAVNLGDFISLESTGAQARNFTDSFRNLFPQRKRGVPGGGGGGGAGGGGGGG